MSPTYVRKINALDVIADSKDKKLMSAFINATKKLAAAHSVRMDKLNELPTMEDQPEQQAQAARHPREDGSRSQRTD